MKCKDCGNEMVRKDKGTMVCYECVCGYGICGYGIWIPGVPRMRRSA